MSSETSLDDLRIVYRTSEILALGDRRWNAALMAAEEAIGELRSVVISPARSNGSVRGATRRKAVFLDDVLSRMAALRKGA